jgi:hypothetical protein
MSPQSEFDYNASIDWVYGNTYNLGFNCEDKKNCI